MKDKYKITTRFRIYEISDDGLLKEPMREDWGRPSPIFNTYGYNKKEDAIKEMEDYNFIGSVVIIETLDRQLDLDINRGMK